MIRISDVSNKIFEIISKNNETQMFVTWNWLEKVIGPIPIKN